jgi:16S rRNA C967 or C1407 C5-methylase (RsmB/RsmF family)/NOL1/NOP2/fmu family ribosome biogenesis protein
MRRLLPAEEFTAFINSFDQPVPTGLRVNTLKISVADFISIAPFSLVPAGDWDPAAFLVADESRPGRHPFHDAGLYYLQDPSAMVAAAMLAPSWSDLVLDLAAAPGGKTTHLATLMNKPAGSSVSTVSPLRYGLTSATESGQHGFLIANDIHAGRARLLAENLARWGPTNTIVVQDTPDRIAVAFGPIFDCVLLDAPCSGEGMFYRQEGIEWSAAIVEACARRQSQILASVPRLVRPGGRLLYATCTFAPEENEQTILAFLSENPDFQLETLPHYTGFESGRTDWAGDSTELTSQLSKAIRLWPHRSPGGGHFLALMRREGNSDRQTLIAQEFPHRPPAIEQLKLWQAFERSALTLEVPANQLHVHQGRLYYLPSTAIDAGGLHLVRTGTLLGEFRPGYFRPAHELALALAGEDCRRPIIWPANARDLHRYLAGEDMDSAGPDGWVLVTVHGYGLGWGKRVSNRLKNHYPRSLRRPPAQSR